MEKKKIKWAYLVKSKNQCALFARKEDAEDQQQSEAGSTVAKVHCKECLLHLSEVKQKHITLMPHVDDENLYEISSQTARVEYTMFKPDFPEQRMHEPYNDLHHNSIGIILRQARYEAVCVVRYWRYTFYSGTEIPCKLIKDPHNFLQLMAQEKNRKRYKIFLIQEAFETGPDEREHKIIYANTSIYDDLIKDSKF